MKKLLKDGLIWKTDGFDKQDILIEQGLITSIEKTVQDSSAEIIDCNGAYILPAIADMHVHVAEKVCGLDLADDFTSLSRLADKCGIAAIGAFVTETSDNPKKQKTLTAQYKQAKSIAQKDFKHQVHWHLTPTVSEVQDTIPLLKEGCDLKFYTTYKPHGIYSSYKDIARWMKDLKDIKPRMLIHCEDDEVVSVMSAFNPFHRPFDHTKRRPEMAEILAVERVLDIAIQHNYPLHIVHVSAPEAALLIKQAKKSAPITCETAPHYLLLNEDKLREIDGHRWLCTPPLRSEYSRGVMLELLQDGLFDAIATDHCPFTKADKDLHYDNPGQVPVGLAGLGATFTLLYETLVKPCKLPLDKLMQLISANPAKLMNLYPRYGAITVGAKAAFIVLQQEPLQNAVPIIPSLAETHNLWQDFSHTINYSFFEDYHVTQ